MIEKYSLISTEVKKEYERLISDNKKLQFEYDILKIKNDIQSKLLRNTDGISSVITIIVGASDIARRCVEYTKE